MEDSKNIVEIKTRLVLHQNEIDQIEQNKEYETNFSAPQENANRELQSIMEASKQEIKEDKGSFAKFCENNSIILFGTTVVLGLVNFSLILLCFCGIPSMPYISISKMNFSLPKVKLPNLRLVEMGFKMSEMNYDTCSILAITISSLFFAIPVVLHKYAIGHKVGRTEKRKVNGDNSKLLEFVYKYPELVFWTGYLLTFVNIALVAACSCGLPQLTLPAITLPSLPKLQFQMPSIPKGDLFTFGINFVGLNISPCIAMSIMALFSLLVVIPFLILCPLSPFYEEMKFKRGVYNRSVNSGKKENINANSLEKDETKNGMLVQYVLQYPQLAFWTGYSLTCLNVVLLLTCFCGVPAFNLPNICDVIPFSILCGLVACVMKCSRGE